MANRNMPATPSEEELREKVNIKNVKNSEERETDNLNTNTDTDSLPTVSSAGGLSRGAGSSSRSQTRIPGPISHGPSSSTHQMPSRKYTSMLNITRPRQPSANDSGIQMDSSMSDAEPTAMSPIQSPVPLSPSEMELKLAEDQTLRELQRVVAEMEAEVAMEEGELEQLDAFMSDQTSLASNEEPRRDPDEETAGPSDQLLSQSKAQQDPPADEVKQGSEQKPASDNDATSQGESRARSEALQEPQANEPVQISAQKLVADGTQINVDKSEQDDPLPGTTTDEVVQDNQQMLKQLTQIKEPEPVKDLLEPIPEASEEKFPLTVLEEPSTGSVEAHLQQAFGNVNQAQVPVPPEEPLNALNGATSGQTDAFNRAETQSEIGSLDLATTSEAGLVAQPSVGSDHRMILLEELLRNANNVELMRRLLQIGAEANMVDSEPDFTTQESSAEDKDAEGETESSPDTSITTGTAGTATGTEASTEEDTELNDDGDEDGMDVISQGYNKVSNSLVWRFLSGKVIHLACPILFCGFAAGLIYMSRKP